MKNTCDICGAKIDPNWNYCGQCSVDLREERTPYTPTKKQISSKKTPEKDESIKWCGIYSLMRAYEMTLPDFVIFVIMFAEGKELGFCDCPICNQGFREYLSKLVNLKEGKKTTPSSREIVIQAREVDIPSKRFKISDLINSIPKQTDQVIENISPTTGSKNAVSIEIDQKILENIILKTLSSKKGKELIHSCIDCKE